MNELFKVKDGLHYHPDYPGIWTDYDGGWRVKDPHFIRLSDGREPGITYYPNGTGWYALHEVPEGYNSSYRDEDIIAIKLVYDEEMLEFPTGEYRIKRNLDSFGDGYPKILSMDNNGVPKLKVRQYRYYENLVILNGELTHVVWEEDWGREVIR